VGAVALISTQRSRYKVKLGHLHALSEANYGRLLRVFPDYEQASERQVLVGHCVLALTVTDRARYTTTMLLRQRSPVASALDLLVTLEVRLYHDVRMTEVLSFQTHRSVQARYDYPNPRMYQRDEKLQQYQFVADLLAFCLREGRHPESPFTPEARS
jgi:hypothetical protein